MQQKIQKKIDTTPVSQAKQAIMARIRRYTNYSPEAKIQAEKRLMNYNLPQSNKNSENQDKDLMMQKIKSKLEKNSASFIYCQNPQQILNAILDFLQRHNLPQSLKIGKNEKLHALIDEEKITLLTGAASANDITSMSLADIAIAETATLVLTSSPQNPVSLNFLPENHIIIVEKNKIVDRYEKALQMIVGNSMLSEIPTTIPRTINFITGPSRSADIEQTLLIGAHGPRKLLVICCEENLSGKSPANGLR